jgi:hypothetical protein
MCGLPDRKPGLIWLDSSGKGPVVGTINTRGRMSPTGGKHDEKRI